MYLVSWHPIVDAGMADCNSEWFWAETVAISSEDQLVFA